VGEDRLLALSAVRLSVQTQQVQQCFAALQYFLLSILLAKGGKDGVPYSGTGHCYACPALLFEKLLDLIINQIQLRK
jgi:hypothetical protein